MAVRDCHRTEFGPFWRQQRLATRSLNHFQRCFFEDAKVAQKLLLAINANHLRNSRRAYVGRFHDNIRHRKLFAQIMAVSDAETAKPNWPANVEHSIWIDQTQCHRLRNRKYFKR